MTSWSLNGNGTWWAVKWKISCQMMCWIWSRPNYRIYQDPFNTCWPWRATFDVNTLNELVMATNGSTSLGEEMSYLSVNEALQVMRKELVQGLNRAIEEGLLVICGTNGPEGKSSKKKEKKAATTSPSN